MALTWAAMVVVLVSIPALNISRGEIVKSVALWSYSIYLTHSLVIHICVNLTNRLNINKEMTSPFWFASIFLVGFAVYQLIEVPSMNFRDRIVPRRGVTTRTETH